jgi:3-dehydroquinate synthase
MTATLGTDPTVVDVALGARSYDIVIGRGVIASLGARIAALRPGAKAFIVTDDNVARYVLANAEAALVKAGVAAHRAIVPAGEASRSFSVFEQVCEAIVASRMERGDLVIALGGGVVGDLAGFAAAVVRRGLDYVQVPTTLLAQVDSSVGGKTAIDSVHGKNLIGAFHQPILVLADTALLDTLPDREFRAGYAEVAKYGLLGDAGFFAWLEANWRDIFSGNQVSGNQVSGNQVSGNQVSGNQISGNHASGSVARELAVAVCCRAKAAIVARDERETGDRALLNLGHTFGHALEAACGFSDRLLHGEAIAIGMALAFEFSARRQGLVSKADAARAVRHLADVGLPTRIGDIPGERPTVDQLLSLIAQDKKVKRGMLTFILVRGIGAAFVEAGVAEREVRAFLSEKLDER